jgi:hypothetical protein
VIVRQAEEATVSYPFQLMSANNNPGGEDLLLKLMRCLECGAKECKPLSSTIRLSPIDERHEMLHASDREVYINSRLRDPALMRLHMEVPSSLKKATISWLCRKSDMYVFCRRA